jgi:hypothetical protein
VDRISVLNVMLPKNLAPYGGAGTIQGTHSPKDILRRRFVLFGWRWARRLTNAVVRIGTLSATLPKNFARCGGPEAIQGILSPKDNLRRGFALFGRRWASHFPNAVIRISSPNVTSPKNLVGYGETGTIRQTPSPTDILVRMVIRF